MISKTTTHSFKEATFGKPTFCKTCYKFIWGLVNQGVQCADCGYTAHFDCQANAHICPLALKAPPDGIIASPIVNIAQMLKVDTSHTSNTSNKSNPPSPAHSFSVNGADATLTAKTNANLPSPNQTPADSPSISKSPLASLKVTPPSPVSNNTQLLSPSDVSIVHGLTSATVKAAMNMESERKAAQPPLNLLTTTPKNFAKFIHRAGVIRAAHEEIMSVLMWENSGKTFMWMIAVIILTLYPYFLVITPQATIIYIILRKYYEKARKQAHVEAPKKSDTGPIASQSMTGISSAEYARNMQWIQNFMGQFVEVFDAAVEYSKIVDWSDENKTSLVLKMTIATALAALVIARLIPTRFLFMTVGVTPFLANTAFIRAVVTSMPALVVAKMMSYYNRGKELFKMNSIPTGDAAVVGIYQNERWWAGLGFIPHLLPSERRPWSDATGLVEMADLKSYRLPAEDWEWADDAWVVNGTWTQVDDDGWCYTDNGWQHPRKSPGVISFTRRRLWTRTMRRINSASAIKTTSSGITVAVKAPSTSRSSSSSSKASSNSDGTNDRNSLGLSRLKAE
ncbi:hypothetical protein SeLEV6574_g01528 [Synchytrium endobioticum]|nr:hypothetical protein SeLEV6574_g01528 [Synchytrium endobioticum]